MDSKYYQPEVIREQVKIGNHRNQIGGMWSELGQLQLDFLKTNGLRPEHFLLDVGCGCLRGGVRFIDYLETGHYYGIDLCQPLLDAGYDEVTHASLDDKLPLANLRCVDDFDASSFGRTFDFAIAQSVFTHLSFNNIRLCMENLHGVIRPGGKFYATYFNLPEGRPSHLPQSHTPGGITTFGNKDPYHYRVDDFRHAIRNLPWTLVDETEWNHPRAQRMIVFSKT